MAESNNEPGDGSEHRTDVQFRAQPTTSWRKGVAAAAIVLLILLWALAIASLSHSVGRWPILVQALFYLFMGIAWVIPLKPLLRWSETGHLRRRRVGDD